MNNDTTLVDDDAIINTTTTTATDDSSSEWQSPSQVLISAISFYLPLWLVGMCCYCILRQHLPRVYAVRSWVPNIRTSLAVNTDTDSTEGETNYTGTTTTTSQSKRPTNRFGYISWIWQVYTAVPDEALQNEISLDALCFLRLLQFGFRISVVGLANSVWLLPVYAAGNRNATTAVAFLQDWSINTVQYARFYIGTIVASYILYGYIMYAILGEFRWFVRQRHAWLRQMRPQNYTILVRNIPKHLRSNVTLREHFQRLYGSDRVYEAHCCVFLTKLQSLLQKREACKAKLEQAVLARESTQLGAVVSSPTVITDLVEELQGWNRDVATQIEKIERKGRPRLLGAGAGFRSSKKGSLSYIGPPMEEVHSGDDSNDEGKNNSDDSDTNSSDDDADAITPSESMGGYLRRRSQQLFGGMWDYNYTSRQDDSEEQNEPDDPNADGSATDRRKRSAFFYPELGRSQLEAHKKSEGSSNSREQFDDVVTLATNTQYKYKKSKWQKPKTTVKAAVRLASKAVSGKQDGKPDDAGFVTFTSLVAMHGALQMKQHPDLFAMETEIAPEPTDIFWHAVGTDREVLQTGRWISLAATLGLCLFWTFVVTFIVNLTDTATLVRYFPWSAEFVENNEGFEEFLDFLSPGLLLLFNSGLLPIILKAVSRLEYPASDSFLEASAFWKMAAFTVIQTFL